MIEAKKVVLRYVTYKKNYDAVPTCRSLRETGMKIQNKRKKNIILLLNFNFFLLLSLREHC